MITFRKTDLTENTDKIMKCTRRYAAMAVQAMFNKRREVLDETPILLVSVFILNGS